MLFFLSISIQMAFAQGNAGKSGVWSGWKISCSTRWLTHCMIKGWIARVETIWAYESTKAVPEEDSGSALVLVRQIARPLTMAIGSFGSAFALSKILQILFSPDVTEETSLTLLILTRSGVVVPQSAMYSQLPQKVFLVTRKFQGDTIPRRSLRYQFTDLWMSRLFYLMAAEARS